MNIFVGSASRSTEVEVYNKLAVDIGNYIVAGKHNYIFGGCNKGLMGVIYQVVKDSPDTNVISSSVEAYKDDALLLHDENPNISISVAQTVNERKNNIAKKADVIIIIPGGLGTLDELFSFIESKRAGEHEAPIFIVNINGYYDSLLKMLETVYDGKFASEAHRELYKICYSFEGLKCQLDELQKEYRF